MCGSLLSKFKSANNNIDRPTSPESRRVASKMKLASQDTACFQDREFWKNEDKQGESSVLSLAAIQSKNSYSDGSLRESDDSSQEELEAAMRSLVNERVNVLPVRSNKKNRLPPIYPNDPRLVETAFEILALQAHSNSSSFNTVRVVQPQTSTESTVPRKVQTAVAFDIPVGDKKTVCPSARVSRRRKRKVAPEPTLEDVKEKMRAAEERKLKELLRIRECARSRAGVSRPHPAESSPQAIAAKIAAKQAAAEG